MIIPELLDQHGIFFWLLAGGLVGSIAKFIITNFDFNKSPYEIEKPKPKSWDVVTAHMLARVILGAIAGLLVGLVLVDAIKMEYSAALKLIFISFIAGYSAPELLQSQEKKILALIDKHLKSHGSN